MIDYYLKFKDKAEAETVLTELAILVEVEQEDSSVVLVSSGLASVDFVGTIYKPTGITITEEDGMEYPQLSALAGYHVNLRFIDLPATQVVDLETEEVEEIPSPIPALLAPYSVEPTTPSRVWA